MSQTPNTGEFLNIIGPVVVNLLPYNIVTIDCSSHFGGACGIILSLVFVNL